MRIVSVVRLSREDEQSGMSPEAQDEANQRWIKDNGHTCAGVARDLGVSGEMPMRKRPDVGQWLTEDRLSGWDGFVGAESSRLFRDLADSVMFFVDFMQEPHKKLVFTADGEIDMSTPKGVEDAFGEFLANQRELRKIKERNKRSAEYYRKQGLWHGGSIPFGYMRKRERDEEGSHWILVPHPENAQIIREIADGIIAGMTVSAAARELTTRGVPTGRHQKDKVTGKKNPITRWQSGPLARLLRNPTLTGHILWQYTPAANGKPETYKYVRDADGKPLRREAILDDKTFAALKTALKRPEQKTGRQVNASMLMRLAFCAQCNAPLWINTFTSRGTVYAYYVCSAQCGADSIAKDGLHKAVDDAVMAYAELPEIKRRLIRGKNYDEEKAGIEGQIYELEMSDRDWVNKAAALKAEYDRYDNMETEPDEWRVNLTGKTIGEVWASLDETGKRDWLRAHGWRFYAERDPEAKKRDTEAVPLVVVEGGESLLSDVAKATGLTVDEVMAISWVPILTMLRERGLATYPAEIERLVRESA